MEDSLQAVERITILLENRENRRLLAEFLSPLYELEFDRIEVEPGSHAPSDLCVVDGPSLHAHWKEILAERQLQDPVLFPVLLLTNRRDVGLMTRELWRIVDDVILRPVEKAELRARIATLRRARRLSLNLNRAKSSFERERRVAHRFQEAALPRSLPQLDGVALDAFYQPGNNEAQVGGDWYDAFVLPDGRLVISVGDVCGSGLEAAVAMSSIRQQVRGLAHVQADPAAILRSADRALQSEGDRLATAFIGVLEPRERTLVYASAGHPSPIVRTARGVRYLSDPADIPLGIFPAVDRKNHEVDLSGDAALVLYTDGILENDRNVVAGEAALADALRDLDFSHKTEPAKRLFDRITAEIGAVDDVAILVVQLVMPSSSRGVIRP